MTQLSPNFSLDELIFSSTAARLNIDNTPTQSIIDNLTVVAQGLEKVRALLGYPMHIDSCYRCPALNKAVGGASDSAHMQGFAADFICPQYGTPLKIVEALAASNMMFGEVIQEGNWVHISFRQPLVNKVLTAAFGANGATYTNGVA
jgi:hypothetical protein